MKLEIRTQGNSKKYYLAYSLRLGNKVKKIRRYLGVNLTKNQLKKLEKNAKKLLYEQVQAYKKLRDPLKYELTAGELNFLDNLNVKNIIKISHLDKEWTRFTEIFTYNTNAIEGGEATQKEVKQILEENKWPNDLKKEDISETYGVAEAINYIKETKEHISINLIKKLHEITFKNSKSFAGKLRNPGIEVVIRDTKGNIVHRGAPSNQITSLLSELIKWYKKHRKKYHPVLLAAVIHNQFENIHPFQDGNGRVGRLLLNNILIKHDFPPLNISFVNRQEYYSALYKYQVTGDIRPTLNLIIKEYKLLKKQLQ